MASGEDSAFSVTPIPVARSMTQRASKFTTPPPPAFYVGRPRLETRLNAAATTRLTVVSGRAGSGKTALVSSWISTIDERDRSWVTLDEDDNDAPTFCANVETAVGYLTRDARAAWRDRYLVLDDAHLITAPDARRSLSETVAIAPPYVHVIVACRGQLPLSLWRVRTAGELVEIGDDDLRFDIAEAAAIVASGGGYADGALAELHADTDGWVTGLKLSTSARHSSVGAREAIREFLLEEVYSLQTPAVQRFLMEPSTLERFTAGVCERVTGRADAADILHDLERDDVFITRLPDQYGTYRLHPQFR